MVWYFYHSEWYTCFNKAWLVVHSIKPHEYIIYFFISHILPWKDHYLIQERDERIRSRVDAPGLTSINAKIFQKINENKSKLDLSRTSQKSNFLLNIEEFWKYIYINSRRVNSCVVYFIIFIFFLHLYIWSDRIKGTSYLIMRFIFKTISKYLKLV